MQGQLFMPRTVADFLSACLSMCDIPASADGGRDQHYPYRCFVPRGHTSHSPQGEAATSTLTVRPLLHNVLHCPLYFSAHRAVRRPYPGSPSGSPLRSTHSRPEPFDTHVCHAWDERRTGLDVGCGGATTPGRGCCVRDQLVLFNGDYLKKS